MAFDIEDWVNDNLASARRSGGVEYTATCPSCGAPPGRFYVNTESGAFVCFKEGDFKGRRIWSLIAHVEGITYQQARAEAMRANVHFVRRRKESLAGLADQVAALRGREAVDEDEMSRVAAELPQGFVPVFKKGRRRPWQRPAYLKRRGVRRETCRDFGIGYVQAGEWYESGSGKGQYIGERIIIPITSPTGYSWSARDLTGHQEPKYVNPRGAEHARLFHGWEHVSLRSDVVLVEGPLDVIGLYQHGIPALALLGKKLNREQLGLLCGKPADASITVMMDPEEVDAPYAVARELHARFVNVFIARLPRGVDPGSATRKQAWSAWDDAARSTGDRNAGLLARLRNHWV